MISEFGGDDLVAIRPIRGQKDYVVVSEHRFYKGRLQRCFLVELASDAPTRREVHEDRAAFRPQRRELLRRPRVMFDIRVDC